MPRIARFAIRWHYIGDVTPEAHTVPNVVCTGHILGSGSDVGFTVGQLAGFADAIVGWWTTASESFLAGREYFTPFTILDDVTVKNRVPADGHQVIRDGEQDAGRFQTTQAPPQCSMGLGLRTAVATRRGRGRLFLPAPPLAVLADTATGEYRVVVDSGRPQEQEIAAVGARLAEAIATQGPAGVPAVLAVYSPTAGAAYAVSHFEIAHFVLTQRRRSVMPRTYLGYSLAGEPLPR